MKLPERHLENVQGDYAEVWWGTDPFDDVVADGYVHIEEFVERTDFEKDEIIEVERWVAKISRRIASREWMVTIGRLTGYATREEAIVALEDYLRDIHGYE